MYKNESSLVNGNLRHSQTFLLVGSKYRTSHTKKKSKTGDNRRTPAPFSDGRHLLHQVGPPGLQAHLWLEWGVPITTTHPDPPVTGLGARGVAAVLQDSLKNRNEFGWVEGVGSFR